MANGEWFEVEGTPCPNVEAATTLARTLACDTDDMVEIYQCTRTLVRTVQRAVTVTQTDIP